jgi:hypothetical protein
MLGSASATQRAIASASRIKFANAQLLGEKGARERRMSKPVRLPVSAGFIGSLLAAFAIVNLAPLSVAQERAVTLARLPRTPDQTVECEILVAGGGLAGTATAYEALLAGRTVCMTDITDWIGGQLTSQGTSAFDEAQKQRSLLFYSRGYKELRQRIERKYGRLNPGDCWVSVSCFIPKDAHQLLVEQLRDAAKKGKGRLKWFPSTVIKDLESSADGKMLKGAIAIQYSPAPNHRLLIGLDSPMGTMHGLSKYPYIREGRRIIDRPSYGYQDGFSISEIDISRVDYSSQYYRDSLPNKMYSDLWKALSGLEAVSTIRQGTAPERVIRRTRSTIYPDSVGIAQYAIGFHPCMKDSPPERPGNVERPGVRHAHGQAYPAQIPLRAMIPQKIDNLLVAGKSIATSPV